MGVAGIPGVIERGGEELKRVPANWPAPRPAELTEPDGPLSAGLAGAHNAVAPVLGRFVAEMDAGTTAGGEALVHISRNLVEIDRQRAGAIERLLPGAAPAADVPAPDSVGGR